MALLLALVLTLLGATAAGADERTFAFSPADLARMVSEFNAQAIAASATPALKNKIKIHGSDVRFFGKACPTLTADGGPAASRVRVLDGASRAAQLFSRSPNLALGAALQSMGAASWTPPADAHTMQPSWMVDAAAPTGMVAFSTAGFATGNPAGKIGGANAADKTPTFNLNVDVTNGSTEPASLVLALTTELPPSRPGRMPKRSECILLGHAYPTDVQALVDLVAAADISSDLRSRLNNILGDALDWLASGKPARAGRSAKRFALEVASRSGSEIPPDAAEEMVTRALQVSDALSL
ncbi:MAG TPA: hypothetical protein VGK30_12395 [Candidatus Binatia bacterium]|jgi:hypothetical protein